MDGKAAQRGENTDEELMLEVRAGRLEELGTLFDRHHRRLFHFCLRLTGDAAVAEDLVQETFSRMLRYRASFRGDSAFLPWMYRVARNVFHDHLAKRRESEDLAASDTVIDGRPGAHDLAVENEQLGLLRRAFLRLPLDRREVLVLARFENRPYAEIAQLLDTTVGAVKVRVHRATNELREVVCGMLDQSVPQPGGRNFT